MNTTDQKKRKRHRKRNNKKQKQQAPKDSNAFVFEYAFESITERGTKFKRNYPEYD